MDRKQVSFTVPLPNRRGVWEFARKWLLPNPGTLVLMVIFALAIPAVASPRQAPAASSTSTISYQGRLADSGGNPLTGMYNLEFRVYDVPAGGTPLWEEFWTGGNSVAVSDGLFNVMLGSVETDLAASIEGQDELYLGITVGTDSEMEPRVQLGAVPFSMVAQSLVGQVTTGQIEDGAVTTAKLNVENGLQVSGDSGVRISHNGSTWGGGVRHESAEGSSYEWLAAVGGGDDAWVNGRGWFLRDMNAGATRLVVDEDGDVGIGTLNPTASLEIQGCGNECTALKIGEYAAAGRQYLQLDVENSDPASTSCDEASEIGRLAFRGDSNILFVCSGPINAPYWTSVALSASP